MSIRKALLMAVMLFLANPFASAKSSSTYVCVPKHSIGYGIDGSGSWSPKDFSVSGKSYFLSEKDGKWQWKEFGEDNEDLNAYKEEILGKSECMRFNEHGFVMCSHYGEIVNFNRETLRFQVINPTGYVVNNAGMAGEPKKFYTPSFIIGICSKAP